MDCATFERFEGLCRRVGVGADRAGAVFGDLVARYDQGHRTYHNLGHIDRMLGWLDASGGSSDAVELAIWFHDAVYEPMGGDNEAKSAEYFSRCLGKSVGARLADDVERLILATNPSMPRSGRDDEDLIIDIDLSILGSPPDEYESYRTAIRSEYKFVPADEFNEGRGALLRSFLSRRIYATEAFAMLEDRARANLRRELDGLQLAGGG